MFPLLLLRSQSHIYAPYSTGYTYPNNENTAFQAAGADICENDCDTFPNCIITVYNERRQCNARYKAVSPGQRIPEGSFRSVKVKTSSLATLDNAFQQEPGYAYFGDILITFTSTNAIYCQAQCDIYSHCRLVLMNKERKSCNLLASAQFGYSNHNIDTYIKVYKFAGVQSYYRILNAVQEDGYSINNLLWVSDSTCQNNCDGSSNCIGTTYFPDSAECWTLYRWNAFRNIDRASQLKQFKFSTLLLNSPASIIGNFDSTIQNIRISGTGYGNYVSSTVNIIEIQYLDNTQSIMVTFQAIKGLWSNTLIDVQYPSLADLKNFQKYKPSFINVGVKVDNIVRDQFLVSVTYPPPPPSKMKCYHPDGREWRWDFKSNTLRLDNGTTVIISSSILNDGSFTLGTKSGPIVIEKLNRKFSLAQNPDFSSSSFLLTNKSGNVFIYNPESDYYIGHDNNTDQLMAVHYFDDRIIAWKCSEYILSDTATSSESTFTTNSYEFVLDVNTIKIQGSGFGTYYNNSVNFVVFELMLGNEKLLSHKRTVSNWTDTTVIINYPQLTDLKYFYRYNPTSVNIVLYAVGNVFNLLQPVRVPVFSSLPFQCSYPDGFKWSAYGNLITMTDYGGFPMTLSLYEDNNTYGSSRGMYNLKFGDNYLYNQVNRVVLQPITYPSFQYSFLVIKTGRGFLFYVDFYDPVDYYVSVHDNGNLVVSDLASDGLVYWDCNIQELPVAGNHTNFNTDGVYTTKIDPVLSTVFIKPLPQILEIQWVELARSVLDCLIIGFVLSKMPLRRHLREKMGLTSVSSNSNGNGGAF